MVSRITVHLIRHEKTAANLARQYIGWTDEPVVVHVKPIAASQPELVYGSDLIRCKQTANGYFPKARFTGNPQLRECHFGDFEMKTYEELQHNPVYRAWIDDPLTVTPPNGESFTSFCDRVVTAFEQIITEQQGDTFVVHGGVIRVLLAKYGLEEKPFQQIVANHNTVYTLMWDSLTDFKGGARCTSYSEALITENEPM